MINKSFYLSAIKHGCHILMAAMLIVFNSCVKEDFISPDEDSELIRFEIRNDGWNHINSKSSVRIMHGQSVEDTLYLHVSSYDNQATSTKAAPVTTESFYGSFGLSAFKYQGEWTEQLQPDFICNEAVLEEDGWATSYLWPGSVYKVQFFAYAPYGCDGLVVSDKSHYGSPTLTYEVPDLAQDQTDIVVSATGELSGKSVSSAELSFSHIMTSVRILTGENVIPGRITKISLNGVYGEGVYSYASNSWRPSQIKDFIQRTDLTVDGSVDQPLMDDSYTFMMIPQTLPDGASISIEFEDPFTEETHNLSASIAGVVFPLGETIIFKIETSSMSIEPVLEIDMPSFTYEGNSNSFYVASYTKFISDGETSIVPVPWTAEFVEEDGNGGYRTIEIPDWIRHIRVDSYGSVYAEPLAVSAYPQDYIYERPHDSVLKSAKPVSGVFDLSTDGGAELMSTSNCYIVSAPGTYSFPLVYGNAIKDGADNPSAYRRITEGITTDFVNHLNAKITDPYIYNNVNCVPYDAVLVWQDARNLVTDVRLDADKKNLLFDIDSENICQGNAVLAVRNSSGTIMWSWHVWVTDCDAKGGLVEIKDESQNVYKVMPYSIGECFVEAKTYPERTAIFQIRQDHTNLVKRVVIKQEKKVIEWASATTYQWGYKNPMVPWSGVEDSTDTKVWYDASGNEHSQCFEQSYSSSISYRIQHPDSYRGSFSNAYWDMSYIWNNAVVFDNSNSCSYSYEVGRTIKTIYDPSPRGFVIMPHFVSLIMDTYPLTYVGPYTYEYDIDGHKLRFSYSGSREPDDGDEMMLNMNSWSSLYRMKLCEPFTSYGACDSYAFQIRSIAEL